jgi:L-threonylcarbamoyladenylate synthase
MKVVDSKTSSSQAIADEVAHTMASGGIAVLPTDTVYGIFCDPNNGDAIERIYTLKNRPRAKALALYVDDVEGFVELAAGNELAVRFARAFLPGPLTIIIARPERVAAAVSAPLATVGVRVPDHALFREILAATGPLAGTSANISGSPAFVGGELPPEFPDADLFVDDGTTALELESTVIDVSQQRAHLIRAGAIPIARLETISRIELR